MAKTKAVWETAKWRRSEVKGENTTLFAIIRRNSPQNVVVLHFWPKNVKKNNYRVHFQYRCKSLAYKLLKKEIIHN